MRITVSGQLSDRLAPVFEGMTLVHGTGVTELVGSVVDQAQLHGLLGRIRDLGLDLESVTVSPEHAAAPDAAARRKR